MARPVGSASVSARSQPYERLCSPDQPLRTHQEHVRRACQQAISRAYTHKAPCCVQHCKVSMRTGWAQSVGSPAHAEGRFFLTSAWPLAGRSAAVTPWRRQVSDPAPLRSGLSSSTSSDLRTARSLSQGFSGAISNGAPPLSSERAPCAGYAPMIRHAA